MKVQIVCAALALVTLLGGCVSVEATKAQLESGNAQLVSQAEKTIVNQALYNQQISTAERIQYVKLTKNPEVLFDICHHASDSRVKSAAVKQIDFSQKGMFVRFIKEFGSHLHEFGSDDDKKASSDLGGLMDDLDGKGNTELVLWMLNSVPMEDLMTVFRHLAKGTMESNALEGPLAKKLAQTVTSEDLLFELLSGNMANRLDSTDRSAVLARLTDQGKLMSLCCDNRFGNDTALFQKISEDTICAFIQSDKRLAKIGETTEANFLSRVRDKKKLAKALIQREDPEGAKSVVTALAQRSQIAVASVAAVAQNAQIKEWAAAKITDKNVIKQVILSKYASDALKIQLISRLEGGDVDEATYVAVTSETVKKALLRKVSPRARAAVRNADRGNCEKMIEAAKAKSAKTFQLGGFYLGMPVEDAERLVGYYYPEDETELKDGRLEISNQIDPFCLADESGRVYTFNFGKAILKNWCKYNAQTDIEWAAAFMRQEGIEMTVDTLTIPRIVPISDEELLVLGTLGNDEDRLMIDDDGYHACLAQSLWRYKANGKNYRIEYFAERVFSKTANRNNRVDQWLLLKLADAFSDVSAAEGTLRVTVSDD